MHVYATRDEAISQLIAPALGEHVVAHDVEAIADAVLGWDDGTQPDGSIRLHQQGYRLMVDAPEFWAAVAAAQVVRI